MLQIGAALFYYKLGQTLLQIGAASLLQIRASVVTNWGSYYKLGQPLLQDKAAITNWSKMYYKLGQVLQIRAIITNWGITAYIHCIKNHISFLGVLRKDGLLQNVPLKSDISCVNEGNGTSYSKKDDFCLN